ncbi:tRNA (guanosine(37)-N1)-methyltransferase TrmD [Aneurinibacillus sp. Ricciae_BoGa-3]|uniref:tRNA (guanosine(37)-N1)-methyltransferase TrmD n=1 Tax=Aneurinibacillus sp. Ricciae_BoGa-3 TaxID=3022697 RepID=UPI00233FC175|nr:tRNA (guanosine(37)-N1)-methyltransferase TrmD [Aneurinibacillus sp. Ricciae_BoGa-3]WCK53003.1 tRNA (guanosine(37)-N1)-methyltransferase TrmD [Aneurinibacillus sp. Ricciae_BoGa-3]
MKIDILTLFPEMFSGVLSSSIIGKAEQKGLVSFRVVNFRDFSGNKHGQVDDTPYGGGGGMVLKPDPIFRAVEHLAGNSEEAGVGTGQHGDFKPRVILLCPQGQRYNQQIAEELAREDHLIFVCGHYEGYDERIRTHLVTDELSIGDYVLTGGELPAMVIIDSVVRLQKGALGNELSAVTDSFSTGLLEYPHYTRPADFRGMAVPDVLLSGHHENIEKWRLKESLRRTLTRRPDLLEKYEMTGEVQKLLEELKQEL